LIYIDDFLIRAIAIGLGVAITGGVLGCFIIWKKMSYFGDSLSHSALLGVLIGVLLGWNTHIGIFFVCLVFVLLLLWLKYKQILAFDTLLGILAHTGLSIAIIGLSLLPNNNISLESILFGDILTVTTKDIWLTYTVSIFVLITVVYSWKKLVMIAIHEDLAKAEGVNVFFYNILFMVLMSLMVALSFRIIGALLITSILIIPPATARLISKSPSSMAIISVILGMVGVIGGITISSITNTPSGATIVLVLATLFILFYSIKKN